MKNKYHEIKFRTRYAETDQMGYIHHSIYAQYFEMGRIDWMNKIGISYKEMEKNGIILPVYTLSVKYFVPLTFDEEIRLHTFVKYLKGARLSFGYEIFNEKNEKSTEAEVVLVFADVAGRPIRPPKFFVDKLNELK